jgi:hypothetical protein
MRCGCPFESALSAGHLRQSEFHILVTEYYSNIHPQTPRSSPYFAEDGTMRGRLGIKLSEMTFEEVEKSCVIA